MSETIKVLREQRAAAGAEILRLQRLLSGDKTDFGAEERQAWDKANADFDAANGLLEKATRAASVEAMLELRHQVPPGLEDRVPGESTTRRAERRAQRRHLGRAHELAMRAWFLRGRRPLTDAHRRACKAVGFSPASKLLEIRLGRRPGEQYRVALGVASGAVGGFLVPQGFVNSLEKAMLAFGGARAVADVMRTETGNPLPWPTAIDTANVGELIAENTAATDDTEPTFGQTTFNAYKFSSKVVLIGTELIEDAAFDMEAEIGSMLGERLGRGQAVYLATGTGAGQPGGIVTGATLGKTAASATAIAPDELIDLQHSVDPAHRDAPGVGWLMRDSTLAVVRKLKDGQGNYLWSIGDTRADFKAGSPGELLGKPVYIDQNMEAVATGARTVVFGDLKKFKIRDVAAVRIRRLDERYAEKDQVAFIAWTRMDSKVLSPGGNSIKYMAQA